MQMSEVVDQPVALAAAREVDLRPWAVGSRTSLRTVAIARIKGSRCLGEEGYHRG